MNITKPRALKKELTFWVAALILFFATIGYVLFTLGFLAQKVNSALLTAPSGAELPVRFDFDTLNQFLGSTGTTTPRS